MTQLSWRNLGLLLLSLCVIAVGVAVFLFYPLMAPSAADMSSPVRADVLAMKQVDLDPDNYDHL